MECLVAVDLSHHNPERSAVLDSWEEPHSMLSPETKLRLFAHCEAVWDQSMPLCYVTLAACHTSSQCDAAAT